MLESTSIPWPEDEPERYGSVSRCLLPLFKDLTELFVGSLMII